MLGFITYQIVTYQNVVFITYQIVTYQIVTYQNVAYQIVTYQIYLTKNPPVEYLGPSPTSRARRRFHGPVTALSKAKAHIYGDGPTKK